MPEEATQAPADEEVQSQETPEEAASAEETPAEQPATDWEQRYNDLRPVYDRGQQELAQYRQVMEAARQGDPEALEFLGLEPAEEETQDEQFVDPDEELRAELEAIKAQLAERDQQTEAQQIEQAEDEWLLEQTAELESKENTQLSDEETELVWTYALNNRHQDGQPDLEGGYNALRGAQKVYQQSYVDSKRATPAPVGAAGEEKIDTSDDNTRRDAMARIMQQSLEASE